jgi:hypothetical protein
VRPDLGCLPYLPRDQALRSARAFWRPSRRTSWTSATRSWNAPPPRPGCPAPASRASDARRRRGERGVPDRPGRLGGSAPASAGRFGAGRRHQWPRASEERHPREGPVPQGPAEPVHLPDHQLVLGPQIGQRRLELRPPCGREVEAARRARGCSRSSWPNRGLTASAHSRESRRRLVNTTSHTA